jgi:hypothetical protein
MEYLVRFMTGRAKGNFKKLSKVALSPIFSSLNSCIVGTEKPTGQIESNLLERTYPLVSALVQS